MDLQKTFRHLGVPVHKTSYAFGDNQSMINSSTYPNARLHKRHNILLYHYVRSMIAQRFIKLTHINSKSNLADVASKHWGCNAVKDLLRPVFHHVGDTVDLYIDDVSKDNVPQSSPDHKVNTTNQWGVTNCGQLADGELVNGTDLDPRTSVGTQA